MAKGKGFVPFGKGGKAAKVMPSDNDGDEKGAAKGFPPKGKAKGNPFAKKGK